MTHSTLTHLKESAYDYISLAQSPAEADMLRFLAIYQLNQHNELDDRYLLRLNNTTSWGFYNAVYDLDYQSPIAIINKIAHRFTHLKFENELSLTYQEKDLCPYHPLLNNFPPLIKQDKRVSLKHLECFKITDAQPYLNQNYRYVATQSQLKQQIDALNHTENRNNRLDEMVQVKRITKHQTFLNLNGQRGVFAKKNIKAGTIIDYYSGEHRQYPDPMPPMLCTWRIQESYNWLDYYYKHRQVKRFNGWTDAFILGNMMKLVNSCYDQQTMHHDLGNIGCYYFHFKSKGYYLSLPVYMAIKDIPQETELLTFYHVAHYKNNHIYGTDF
ncbi:MAG: hypothetical protein ACJARD_000748 [Alphaproteobacteria bacterium]|jgi:hypothetical protein